MWKLVMFCLVVLKVLWIGEVGLVKGKMMLLFLFVVLRCM